MLMVMSKTEYNKYKKVVLLRAKARISHTTVSPLKLGVIKAVLSLTPLFNVVIERIPYAITAISSSAFSPIC